MCRLLGVSTSAYYAWQGRAPSGRAESDRALLDRIRDIHRVSRGTYGAPRIHAELVDRGCAVGRKRIARLTRRAGLRGISRRKGTRTTVRERVPGRRRFWSSATSPPTHPIGSGSRTSPTHNVGLQGCTEGYVVQTEEAAPHDDVSRRPVLGAGEIDAERAILVRWSESVLAAGGSCAGSGTRQSRMFVSMSVSTRAGSRVGSMRLSVVSQNTRQPRIQRHPDQPDRPLGSSQARLLRPAARFPGLVEDLDLPAHGVPRRAGAAGGCRPGL